MKQRFSSRSRRVLTATLLLVASAAGIFNGPNALVAANCTPPPGGLVAWWPGEGGSLDITGANNGVLSASGASYTAGIIGQAFRFDGTNGYVQIPDAPALKPANVTVEAWVWLDPALPANRGGEQIIFKKNTWSAWFEGYSLLKNTIDNGNGTFSDRFEFTISRTGNQVILLSSTIAQRGVWYHVAATYDGNRSTLYVNGVAEATAAPGFALDYGTTPVYIGTSGTWAPYLSMFGGIIDEPAIYNRALATNEIAAIYNAGSAGKCTPENVSCTAPPAGLVAWWKGNGNGTDSAGTNILLLNEGTAFTDGKVGQAFSFDGTAGYAKANASPSLDVGSGPGFTVEAWINPADISNGHPIVEWNGGAGYDFGVHLWLGHPNHGPGYLFANIATTERNWRVVDTVPGAVASGVYQHVALTYDKTSGLARILVNGAIAGEANLGSINPQTSYPVYIGRRPPGDLNSRLFAGAIDEVSLYNRALATNEIAAIYNAGSGGKCASTSSALLPPIITNFSPKSGASGAIVTLSGTNFSPAAGSNIVYFGAVRATVKTASPNSLTVIVPSGASYAPITVTANGLTAYSPAAFAPTFTGNGAAITSATFAPSFNLAAASPYGVVIADLNGDGKPDLAIANVFGNSFSIYQNIGSNNVLSTTSFAAPVMFPVGSGSDDPTGITAADVDGDGKLDLIIADRNNNRIHIFKNLSSGGWLTTNALAAPITVAVAADPRRVAVRDLNGDGHPDIVTANASGSVSILRNIGSAGTPITASSFAPHVDLALAGSSEDVAIGDLDGDGWPDLALADSSGFISLFRNNGTAGDLSTNTFDARVDLPAQSQSLNVVIGDLDGDGKPELITSAYLPQTMSVYRNLASPGSLTVNSFAFSVDYRLAGRGHTAALGDINGDGKPDVTEVTELASALSIFQNIGTGSFANTSLATRVDYATGWNAWGVAVGDLDGDGRPDVVFGNQYDNTLQIYKNVSPLGGKPIITSNPANQTVVIGSSVTLSASATGTAPLAYQWFFNQAAIPGATNAVYSIASVSMNAAGSYQIQASNPLGSAWSSSALLTVTPAPVVPVITSFTPKTGPIGSLISITGTNFSPEAGSNVVYFGAVRAAVAFASPTTLRVIVPVGATFAPPSVTVNRLTGSAKTSFTPTFAGSGLLTAASFPARVNLTPGTGPTSTLMADFDGDGKPDLAVTDGTTHTVSVYRNISTNGRLATVSFGPRIVLTGVGGSGNTPYMMVAADVDGDGWLDLITTDLSANSVSVFRNLATPGILTSNSFAARVSFTVGTGPRDLAVTDLDADGRPEIVAANYGSSTVSILRNIISSPGPISSNSFAARIDFPAGSGAHGVAVADLDGDGKRDIAIANSTTTTISLLRNVSTSGTLTAASFAAPTPLAAPSYPHFIRAADLDGDGKLELILTTYLSQSVCIYRNLATPGSLSAASFAPRVEFALGARGHTISIGDLNGDSKPDVVVDCEIPNRICLFQNLSTNGSFTASSFAARVDLPAGYNAWGSSVGDLDGDGRPDIAFANYYDNTISISRNLGAFPPIITQQPASQSVMMGDLVVFNLVVFSAGPPATLPLSYQWRFNGDAIAGATNSSLLLPEAQLAQAGNYSVTVANAAGSVTSSNASLTVTTPTCTQAPSGLVTWWPGEGNANDSVGTNNGGLLNGASFTTGKIGLAFLFGTTNASLKVPPNADLNTAAGSGLTFESWVNPTTLNRQAVAEWNDNAGNIGTHLFITESQYPTLGNAPLGCLYANLVDTSGVSHVFSTSGGLVKTNTYQHVALTYDKSSGMAVLYLNGNVAKTAYLGSFVPQTSFNFYVGVRPSGSFAGANFNGAIDDPCLYNRALASNEIAAIYAARGAGKCPLPPTVLSVTPTNWFVNEGSTVAYTVTATGSPTLAYQWQHNGADIPNATSATLILSNVLYAQAGHYAVVVSNPAGLTTSSNVVLRVNRAPVADASASESLVISPNGTNAIVMLDGSRSSDPDGDALTYAWFHAGDTNFFGTGVALTPALPVGTNQLTLTVNDGMASGSQAFINEVITTLQAVDRLIERVKAGAGGSQPLIASLRAALAAIDRSQPATAIHQLEAFINKVQSQVAPNDPALAAQLIANAQAIIDALNGGSSNVTTEIQITAFQHSNNGKHHLNIKGGNGRVYIVETSTNMVDWTPAGVASKKMDGDYEFDASEAREAGARFYRVVSPK